MKHQRCYHLLCRGAEAILPRLRFEVAWQDRMGGWLLMQLNRIGARWIYEALSEAR